MLEHTIQKLEFYKIQERVASFSKTYIGKLKCFELLPSFDDLLVKRSLNETSQAISLCLRKGNAPIFEISDISVPLKQLDSNLGLSAKSLLDIAVVFKLSRILKDFFFGDTEFDISSFDLLASYFSSLYTNKKLEDLIFNCIVDGETIADSASSELSSIRRNKRKLEQQIKDDLNQMIHSSYSKYIMEPIVTIRNDRYVIPVKEAYRSYVKGFIHDVSSSGSTIFVEPLRVFELNNKYNNLKLEENLEIEKILMSLSTAISPYVENLRNNLSIIGTIDLIFAKALYANELDATIPIITDKKQVCLLGARHPFIPKDKVVPVDISIGVDFSSLIITGPNTGGKTVTLKTVGLLVLMACCGLAIPAKDGSSIFVFDQIFADIGDEQSIGQSLSTFSAHMVNIIDITNRVSSNSLVLLDELGSGTDPLEGSSLAISILEYFYSKGCLCFCTTHYEEVKKFALVTDGFENASCEFDIESLSPTYNLLVGIPGKSNAFAISKRLGLDNNILCRAELLKNDDDIAFEDVLKSIYEDKKQIELQKQEIEKNLHQVELLRKSLELESTKKESLQKELSDKAKIEARNILLSTKEKADAILKELNELSSKNGSVHEANKLREQLNKDLKSLYADKEEISPIITKDSLKVGDKVLVHNFSEPATICSISGKSSHVQVQFGGFAKMKININDIEKLLDNNSSTSSNFHHSSNFASSKSKLVSPELNVIGQNVEDACFLVDKYLDDCALAKLEFVRIVHGKGTGKLRDGIHAFLKKHPHVQSFRLRLFW